MVRGCLVGLIHSKTLTIQDRERHDGSAITLMSTEVDRVEELATFVHAVLARTIEVIVGVYLLTSELGWISLIPIALAIGASISIRVCPSNDDIACSRLSRLASRDIGTVSQNWSKATQSRIAKISSVLDYMKSIKMQGMANLVEKSVQHSRQQETDKAAASRMKSVQLNAIGKALFIFSDAANGSSKCSRDVLSSYNNDRLCGSG